MREGLAHHLLGSLPAPALRGKALVRGKNPQKLSYTWAVDPKPPRPGLRARWTFIGVFCALIGSLAGRCFVSPPRARTPHALPPDPEGDRLLNEALLASSIRDSLRQRASDSPATQRRADEAATRTYGDSSPTRAERRAPSRLPAPTLDPVPTPAPAPPAPDLKVAAEVTDLTPLPDSLGNLYFIGLYHNTGEATIDLPRAELTLWGHDGQKLATATGFTGRHQLLAGEATPLKVLFTKAPSYARMTAQVSPKRELYPRHRPRLELGDIRLGRDRYAGYRVTGTVHNRGSADVQYVQLIALLYDAQEQLVGLDSRFTAQRFLPAGESDPFEVAVSLVRGAPTRVQLDYQALEVPAGASQSR